MASGNRGIVILYEDITEYWIELLAEAGLNTLGIHKIAVPGTHSIDSLLSELSSPGGRKLIETIEGAGVTVEYELHALEWLLPRELFRDKPEFFRMNAEGIRTNDYNLCSSNAEALETVSEYTRRLAKLLNQTSDHYFLWLDDTADGHCHCETCRDRSNADKALIISNAILRGLRTHNNRAKLSFLSYGDMLQKPTIQPSEGIFLEFAPMERNHSVPINTPGEKEGKKYTDLLGCLLEIFKPEETHILEYWLDNALYSGYRMPPVKVPFLPEVTEADIKYYTGLGIQNIKTFGSFIGGEYFKLYGKPPVKEYGEILKKYIK